MTKEALMQTVFSQKGSALLTVLGIISVMSIVSTMLAFTATQQTRSSLITRDMLKARMIAESGLNKAYHTIKDDFSKAKGYTLAENFSDGAYKVTSKTFQGVNANRAQLTATGVCGMGSVIVGADLENIPLIISNGDGDDTYYSTDFDLLTGGELDLKGNFGAHVNNIHANGSADLKGSAAVDATIISSSGSATWFKKPANVTLLSNQPAREIFPAALQAAINAFIDFATANGAVYASGSTIPYAPPGGVAVCTGSSNGWNGNGTGCFIFLGDMTTKHMNITSVNGYPSLISLSPNPVHLNAGTLLNGAVLLPNAEMKLNGHAAIYGPLLVGQGMTGNGTADLYAGGGQGFSLPPKESQVDKVIITAWH